MDEHKTVDNEAVLPRAKMGDEAALKVIYDRHFSPVFRTALRYTGSVEPGFNPIRSMIPYAKKALERKLQPREVANDIGQFLWKNLWMIKSFPNDFLQFLHKFVKGKAEIKIDHQGLEEIGDRADKGGSRLKLAILVLGSGIVGYAQKTDT